TNRCIHECRCFLDIPIRAADLDGHMILADRKMHQRALRLRSPVVIGGNFDLSHGVGFLSQTASTRSHWQVQNAMLLLVIQRFVWMHMISSFSMKDLLSAQ